MRQFLNFLMLHNNFYGKESCAGTVNKVNQ
jgi:hypothetical protein